MRTSTGQYSSIIANAMRGERIDISVRWLARLNELLEISAGEVFPTDQLLDHIPALVGEIAAYLESPETEEIAANTSVIEKARELGTLRYTQRASVHQLLREYEILGEILERFVDSETVRLQLAPAPAECFEVLRRLTRAERTLMRTTVDTFVDEYMRSIEDRNERIAQFNRLASHELRTPIGTLTFAAELLGSETVKEDATKLAQVTEVVRNNIKRVAWLIDNLQRLARIDGAVEVPTRQRVEVSVLAGEAANQLADMAAARGVAINVQPRMPVLETDPARLELILLNLMSNAIKYSDPAKPHRVVEVFGQPALESSGQWQLCVRDNGLGIADGDREKIFERFFRAHTHLDQTLSIQGSGLGLAIVAECVAVLNASIACRSELGRGTEFRVTFPQIAAD